MISFDTNVLVYATAAISDEKVTRARDLLARNAGCNERPIATDARGIQQRCDPKGENTSQ